LKNKIEIEHFLLLSADIPIIDVRSPGEYNQGHIPGSYNIPLFNDEERAIVGTKYRKEGRNRAILAGLDLIGPSMAEKLNKALLLAENSKLLVHCWRGGMRSESMAWLFSLGGIDTMILEGGYKAYRNHILNKLSEPRRIIVLGGLTGSSKTHILKYLRATGNNIIDLEGLANHKGSAFGSLGQDPQPTSEQFSNLIFTEWRKCKPDEIIWVEDESKNIGNVFIPDQVYKNMQGSPLIALIININARIPRLAEEYSKFPAEELTASVKKISKRLGGDNTRDAIEAIEKNDYQKAIEITLKYYDKAYLFGLKNHPAKQVYFIESESNDIEENAMKVLEIAKKILWHL